MDGGENKEEEMRLMKRRKWVEEM